MAEGDAYIVIRKDVFESTPPSVGDQSGGVMRLSGLLVHSRANVWQMP